MDRRAMAWMFHVGLLGLTGPAGLVGCVSDGGGPVRSTAAYPPDFAMVFYVSAPPDAPGESAALRRTAQHVLEPRRKLRVALGRGVSQTYYPPPTATLTPGETARLYQLAQAAGLLEPAVGRGGAVGGCGFAFAACGRRASSGSRDGEPVGRSHHATQPAGAVTYHITITADGADYHHVSTPERNAAATALLAELVRLRGGE